MTLTPLELLGIRKRMESAINPNIGVTHYERDCKALLSHIESLELRLAQQERRLMDDFFRAMKFEGIQGTMRANVMCALSRIQPKPSSSVRGGR